MSQTSTFFTFFRSSQVPSVSATNYNNPTACDLVWNATESNMGTVWGGSDDPVMTNWIINIATDPANGAGVQSWTFTLRDSTAGADTAAVITISEGSTSGTYAGPLTLTRGHRYVVRCDPANTPTATGKMNWRWTQVANAQPICVSVAGGTQIAAGQTRFAAPQYGGIATDECSEPRPWPTSGTFQKLHVVLGTDPGGSGQSVTVTLRQNAYTAPSTYAGNADAALTCAVNTGSTSNTDLVNTVHVNQGDIMDWKIVASASAATTKVFIGYEFVPDTPGEMVVTGEIFPGASVTRYSNLAFFVADATESNVQTPFPAGTLKYFFTKVSNTSSTYSSLVNPQTMTLTLRSGGADAGSPSTIQLVADSTSQTWKDLTNTITIADGDLIDLKCVTTATGANVCAHWGAVLAITQPAVSSLVTRRSMTGCGV